MSFHLNLFYYHKEDNELKFVIINILLIYVRVLLLTLINPVTIFNRTCENERVICLISYISRLDLINLKKILSCCKNESDLLVNIE